MQFCNDHHIANGGDVVDDFPPGAGQRADATECAVKRQEGRPGMMRRLWKRLSDPDPTPEVQEAVRAFEASFSGFAKDVSRDG